MKNPNRRAFRELASAELALVRGGLGTETQAPSGGWVDPGVAQRSPAAASAAAATPQAGTAGASMPAIAAALDQVGDNPHGQTPASPLSPAGGGPAAAMLSGALAGSPEAAKQVEEMITLYHISNNPGWATEIASGKQGGLTLDKLRRPISPDLARNMRKDDPRGDGRGGDDLGPGFYTGNSANFVDEYAKNYDPSNPASVLQFQLPKAALEALRVKSIAPDDNDTFQQYMQDGFSSWDPKAQKAHHAKLDLEAPQHDLLTGPINDIHASVNPKEEGGRKYVQGSILQMGDETPLQYNFATKAGVEALYNKASSIQASPMADWIKQRAAAKQGQ